MAASPRMKIAFINQPWDTAVPPVQAGSIPIWTYEVARRLAQSGDVIVYARRGRSHKKEEYHEGVRYCHVSVKLDRGLNGLSRILQRVGNPQKPHYASPLHFLGYALAIANDLRAQKCDVVHIHNFSQFVPIIRAINPDIKIVLHMHCEWLTQLDAVMIERRLRRADLVVGCSDYITGKIQNRFPQFANLCKTVYNGVDPTHFANKVDPRKSQDKKIKKLLFVGRISPEKGLHILLDAFQKVVESYPQAKLAIVGPNKPTPISFIVALSDEPSVLDLAQFQPENYFSTLKSQLSPTLYNQISFVGNVPHSQLIDYYRDADVLINPSLSEAFGMSLVEAMATGVPVIATRVGGMANVVEDGKTGLLVEPANAPALAEAILCILSDEDLRIFMGKNGIQRVLDYFSWEKVAATLLDDYQNIFENQEQVRFETSITPVL